MKFLLYIFLEVLFTISFGNHFGILMTFLEIIGTFFVGLFIIQTLNISMRENIMRVLQKDMTTEEFVSLGVFRLIGAILLMIPGVFSDFIGLLMQFEFTSSFFANKFISRRESYKENFDNKEDDIIDVEIIEDRSKK